MAVFHIEKTRDYTVMSNHHLRDKSLSLKAKGLLSLMLSLPEEWDYTTKGLARICKDGVDSICAGVRELEEHGYVIRQRVRNPNGQLGAIEYTILEQPRPPEPGKPERENPVLDNPEQAYPVLDELVELMVDTVCSRRETIRIAGDDYPAEVVKSRFLKLDSSHIEYVLDRMRENTTYVRNIKKYLLAALYNAPATIGSYYTSLVSRVLCRFGHWCGG